MIRRSLITLILLCGCATRTDSIVKRPPEPPPVATPRAAPPAPPPLPPLQPPLRQELPPEEEHRLAEGARQNIGSVARLIGELEGRSLKPPQKEALESAKTFLDQARTALGQRDYPRAANLAIKARALTDDLAATSR